jgi:hypothetical protein
MLKDPFSSAAVARVCGKIEMVGISGVALDGQPRRQPGRSGLRVRPSCPRRRCSGSAQGRGVSNVHFIHGDINSMPTDAIPPRDDLTWPIAA